MRYLSVCSGIEAASAAWEPLGWSPVAFAEIEKFPAALLAHRFPEVPNLGDITEFRGWNGHGFDLLVGGTPCQSFSVAGLRQGLADPRGNLMLTYLAIAARYRPEWLVWENVPGVLSADEGRAFGSLVQGMAELGYHASWRVLDAQYVRVDGYCRAVPQRRRRVFVVGHLGDWRRAAAVLFDAQSLRGDTAPRREKGEGVAAEIEDGFGSGGANGIAHALRAKANLAHHDDVDTYVARCVTTGHGQRYDFETDDFVVSPVVGTLNSAGGRAVPGNSVQDAMAGQLIPSIAQTLTRGAESSGKGGYAGRRQEDDANIVAFNITPSNSNRDYNARTARYAQSITGQNRVGARGGDVVSSGVRIRRLTPTECERLQGFPDGWTNVPYRGKPAADGPRYKALGNSMAVNCMRWIGRRIEMVEAI